MEQSKTWHTCDYCGKIMGPGHNIYVEELDQSFELCMSKKCLVKHLREIREYFKGHNDLEKFFYTINLQSHTLDEDRDIYAVCIQYDTEDLSKRFTWEIIRDRSEILDRFMPLYQKVFIDSKDYEIIF